jgi:hypothetical protein
MKNIIKKRIKKREHGMMEEMRNVRNPRNE